MRTCLKFCSKVKGDSLFFQILENDINLNENDTLEYNDSYFLRLNSLDRKSFEEIGLSKGIYKVISSQNQKCSKVRHFRQHR